MVTDVITPAEMEAGRYFLVGCDALTGEGLIGRVADGGQIFESVINMPWVHENVAREVDQSEV